MNTTATNVRGPSRWVFAGSALAMAAAATIAAPTANATPCTAAGLAGTLSSVTSSAGQYLDAHPDVDQALTAAGGQSPQDAQAALKGYFVTHPQELADLRGIAQPLNDLKAQCNATVSAGEVAALLQAFAG